MSDDSLLSGTRVLHLDHHHEIQRRVPPPLALLVQRALQLVQLGRRRGGQARRLARREKGKTRSHVLVGEGHDDLLPAQCHPRAELAVTPRTSDYVNVRGFGGVAHRSKTGVFGSQHLEVLRCGVEEEIHIVSDEAATIRLLAQIAASAARARRTRGR